MAEALDQAFQLHGDEGLVLDDQDVGGDLGGELAAGFLDQRAQRHHVDVENSRRLRFREAFERDQQERLPRHRRDAGELALARQRCAGRRRQLPLSEIEFQILVNSR